MINNNGFQKAQLVDVSKVTGTPSFFLSKSVVKIGRASANDFIIKEKTVSGKHAVIEPVEGNPINITRDLKDFIGERK